LPYRSLQRRFVRPILDQLFCKVLDLVSDQHGSLLQQFPPKSLHASFANRKNLVSGGLPDVLPWVSAALGHFRDAERGAAFERFQLFPVDGY
jgi:hypothetical protein